MYYSSESKKKEFLNDSCEKVFTVMSGNSTRITHNLKFDLCERIVHGNVQSISEFRVVSF